MTPPAEPKPTLKGYVYHLSDGRILERLETEDTFTDVFGYGEVGDRQLALISFEDGAIDAMATMVRGQAVASYKRVVRFAAVTMVEPPLELADLQAAFSRPPGRWVADALLHGGPSIRLTSSPSLMPWSPSAPTWAKRWPTWRRCWAPDRSTGLRRVRCSATSMTPSASPSTPVAWTDCDRASCGLGAPPRRRPPTCAGFAIDASTKTR